MDTPGARLRHSRKARGMSAESLANLIGASASAVRNQENGANGISATRAAQYAEILGISPTWLLYGEGQPPADTNVVNFPIRANSPITLAATRDGNARITIDAEVPMTVALQILAMIQEAKA